MKIVDLIVASFLALALALAPGCSKADSTTPAQEPKRSPRPTPARPEPVPEIPRGPRTLPVDIPRNALKYRSALVQEVRYQWGLSEPPALFFAQVHQESAWRDDVSSAYAHGISQFTPSTAEWIQSLYPADLTEFCDNPKGCPFEARWGLRAMVIYDKRLYAYFTKSAGDDRYAFMLASYNGGLGWAQREQRSAAAKGKDASKWFGQVEGVCLRAKWACEENRAYPQRILYRWRPVYADWLGF